MKTSCLATLLAPLLQIDIKGKITRFGKNRGGHDAFMRILTQKLLQKFANQLKLFK